MDGRARRRFTRPAAAFMLVSIAIFGTPVPAQETADALRVKIEEAENQLKRAIADEATAKARLRAVQEELARAQKHKVPPAELQKLEKELKQRQDEAQRAS